MKSHRLSRTYFLLIVFYMRDTKMKMTLSFLPLRASTEPVLFDLERSISKFDLRSGQDRSRSGHHPSRSICISSEAASRARSLGTIRASLSPSCHDLLATNGL